MSRPRPRRAVRPTATVRVARVAVPLALAGLVTSGVAAFALPGSDAKTAVPAPATTAPEVAAVRDQPVSRDLVRTPSPTPTATKKPAAAGKTKPSDEKATAGDRKKAAARAGTAEKALAARKDAARADALAAHPEVSRTMWATDDLRLRTDPTASSAVVTVVDEGTRLAATRVVRDGFRLVRFQGQGRWVTAAFVSGDKPATPATKSPAKKKVERKSSGSGSGSGTSGSGSSGGTSRASCSQGSGMEAGLTPDAVLVHRTLCARFPQITSYGGVRSGGESFHATGQAVDCMISSSSVGWQVAKYVRAHARALGVSEVLYAQHIWTVQRSSEGWRPMPDRGSATANHFDHVHVSVYGHRAS